MDKSVCKFKQNTVGSSIKSVENTSDSHNKNVGTSDLKNYAMGKSSEKCIKMFNLPVHGDNGEAELCQKKKIAFPLGKIRVKPMSKKVEFSTLKTGLHEGAEAEMSTRSKESAARTEWLVPLPAVDSGEKKSIKKVVPVSKIVPDAFPVDDAEKLKVIRVSKGESSTHQVVNTKVLSVHPKEHGQIRMKTLSAVPAESRPGYKNVVKIGITVNKNEAIKRCENLSNTSEIGDLKHCVEGPERKRIKISPKECLNREMSKKPLTKLPKKERNASPNLEGDQYFGTAVPSCKLLVGVSSHDTLPSIDPEYDPELASVINLTRTCKSEPMEEGWQNVENTDLQVEGFFDRTSVSKVSDEITRNCNDRSAEFIEFDRKPALNKEEICSDSQLYPRILKLRDPTKKIVFQCEKCGYSSKYKNSLKRHVDHCGSDITSGRRSCIFPNCEVKFYHVSQMIRHMEIMHSASIGVKNMVFSTFEEFIAWKEQEEISNFTYFTKHRGDSQTKNGFYSVYICQNDGTRKTHRRKGEPPRLTNRKFRKGTIKTGATCPSRMFVSVQQDQVTVKYFYSHNHELKFENTQFHPITPRSSEYIKKRFSLGASPRQVQDELRNTAVCRGRKDGDSSGIKGQLISLRTLYSMKHEFLSSFRLDKDDANSVFLLVKEWEKEEFNPILLYKPQFSPIVIGRCNQFFPLETELFFIALQTNEQMKILNSGVSHFLCIDTTFCLDKNGFYLFNLIIIDESGNTVPVVHFISNRRTEEVLSFFFLSVKDQCPNLKVHGIMTDPDCTGLEAAKSVFDYVGSHVVCQWHIKKCWQKKLEGMVDSELQMELMCSLTAMLQEADEVTLKNIMSGFKVKYENVIPKFVDFFQSNISNQPEIWAACFRDLSVSNGISSMYSKLFHDKLEIFFTKSKAKKRIDDLLLLLLRIEEDNAEQRKKQVNPINYPAVGGYVVGNHAKSLDIADGDVAELDGSWRVVCQEDRNKVYEVIKVKDECTEDLCSPECVDLPCGNLCSHLYTCSCNSNSGLCEHIHKVHSGKSNVIIICSPDSPAIKVNEEVILHEDPFEPEPTEKHKKVLMNSAYESLSQLGAYVNQPHIQRMLLPHIASVLEQLVVKCQEVSQSQSVS